MSKKPEVAFLYRPVSSSAIPGFVVDKIGEDVVSPKQTPFQEGFVADFSRLVTSHRRSKSIPQLVQVSTIHKRAFEIQYSPQGFIYWADEEGIMYGILQNKGGNTSKPDVQKVDHAPSGFIVWGIQDSDSILRTVRASKILRTNNITTETIVRLIEPQQLQYNEEIVSPEAFKRRLVKKAWEDNHKKTSTNEAGWRSVTRRDIPKLNAELQKMTFYISTLGRQVSERFMDLVSVSSKEDFQKMIGRAFSFWNERNQWLIIKHLEPLSPPLDINNPEDVITFFTTYLPEEIARNYARLHNLNLVHTYPHLGNVSLVGSIYDIDSVYGAPLGIGDEDITEEQKMEDVSFLVAGKDRIQYGHGIVKLLEHLEKKGFLPTESEAGKKFGQVFAIKYITERGWDSDTQSNLNSLQRLLRICNIDLFSEEDKDFTVNLAGLLGEATITELRKRILLSYYDYPLVVDAECIPFSRQTKEQSPIVSNLTPEERKEMIDRIKNLLVLHQNNLEGYPDRGKDYFSFPKVSTEILQYHSQFTPEEIADLINNWVNGDLKDELGKQFSPKAIGSFMLTLAQTDPVSIFRAIRGLEFNLESQDLPIKFARLNEFYDLLPFTVLSKDDHFMNFVYNLIKDRHQAHNILHEAEKRSAITLFGRGLMDNSVHGNKFHEIFNHQLTDIIFNEFTNEQAKALQEAILCPDLVDTLMGFESTTYLLRAALTGVQARNGQQERLALTVVEPADKMEEIYSADLQYFFASAPQSEITDERLKRFMAVKIDGWRVANIVGMLMVAKKPLHPQSYFAQSLRESNIDADHIVEILKTALDTTDGNLQNLDPVLKEIIESKSYQGMIKGKKAAELVQACIGFGVDLPKTIEPLLLQSENSYAFMNFLSEKDVRRDKGTYAVFQYYPTNPIYALMSQGVKALPAQIQDLFANHSEDQPAINSFTTEILKHLYVDGYMRNFFKGEWTLDRVIQRAFEDYGLAELTSDNYPPPPFEMRKLRVQDAYGKNKPQIWRIVHPDIWSILRLADTKVITDFIHSELKEGTVFVENQYFDENGKLWYGQWKSPLLVCLPPDIYEKIKTELPAKS